MKTWEVGRLLLVSQAEFLLLSRNRSLSGDSLQVHSGKLEQSPLHVQSSGRTLFILVGKPL